MKQYIIVALIVLAFAGCIKALAMNEAAANEYRSKQSEQPLVLGHRIGPNGQEMLVIK